MLAQKQIANTMDGFIFDYKTRFLVSSRFEYSSKTQTQLNNIEENHLLYTFFYCIAVISEFDYR